MTSVSPLELLSPSFLCPTTAAGLHYQLLSCFLCPPSQKPYTQLNLVFLNHRRHVYVAVTSGLTAHSLPVKSGVYTVGDFMKGKDELHIVKPTTTVDQTLEMLVENRITGFPVVNDDWKLVLEELIQTCFLKLTARGLYIRNSLLKIFNEVQQLLSKVSGQVVGDLMTPAPVVVHESTNLEDAARILLETKYRRLPVVDDDSKLIGIMTRGNVVRAALQIKRAIETV